MKYDKNMLYTVPFIFLNSCHTQQQGKVQSRLIPLLKCSRVQRKYVSFVTICWDFIEFWSIYKPNIP